MIISKKTRHDYELSPSLLDEEGRIDLSGFYALRTAARSINSRKEGQIDPENLLRAGELYALGVLDRIFGRILSDRLKPEADLSAQTLTQLLGREFAPEEAEELFAALDREFPVGNGEARNRERATADLLRINLINENPAAAGIRDLVDDSPLAALPVYRAVRQAADPLFSLPPQALPGETLLTMLRRPFSLHPESLRGQLQFILDQWAPLVQEDSAQLLSALDFLAEEERPFFGGGPGEQHPYSFSADDAEGFSPDHAWMPRVVMTARNILVWLHQLSTAYGEPLRRLDEIPDKELDELAGQGFNALWLIGIWQRSDASRRIKQLSGNSEAEASAYALKNYNISPELGGWEALISLRDRAAERGIRLAGDMVPNHTGIDADWIYEHPEYYLQVPVSPYPSYTFTGENLSSREGFGIYLEDHYYDRSDAAVVFKHVDFATGRERYIYHGNDGTRMPWNDTAQLNYLDSAVREAVMKAILSVAGNFPIIRFDAAMTLAKEHIHRLWFPEPGKGGAIPSRAEHAMTTEDFNRAVPREFWREVVDRVADEVPGTLLLAEAFWMMEGYFVRSLGMHRVYNSAFMNMLKNEENEKYRQTLINTLQFDREILNRFVNFMNNPDEDTAIAQFGSGDKYFGVCTMLATMPGLPMFGHGQIEGYTEKYGMEFRRSYREEEPDAALLEKHTRGIFPLLRRRGLFASAENFTLFELIGPSGVDHNLFAYSNRNGDEAALILYNNSSRSAAGTIRFSVPYRDTERKGELCRRSLGEALEIPDNPRKWLILRLHDGDLEFIRNCRDIARRGLSILLPPYGLQVFLDFRIVDDDPSGRFRDLAEQLNGSACPSVEREFRLFHMKPLHALLAHALRAEIIALFSAVLKGTSTPPPNFLESWSVEYREYLTAAGLTGKEREQAEQAMRKTARTVFEIARHTIDENNEEELAGFRGYLQRGLEMRPEAPAVIAAWCLTEGLGEASPSLMDEHHLSAPLRDIFEHGGLSHGKADYGKLLVKLITENRDWYLKLDSPDDDSVLLDLLHQPEIQDFLLVNRYNGILWFNKDRFEDMLWWFYFSAAVRLLSTPAEGRGLRVNELFSVLHRWLAYEEQSAYKLEELIALLSPRQADRPG